MLHQRRSEALAVVPPDAARKIEVTNNKGHIDGTTDLTPVTIYHRAAMRFVDALRRSHFEQINDSVHFIS